MCQFSCIMTYTSSKYMCPVFIIFMSLVTNESFILLNVSLTKAVIGNVRAPFKIEFIHLTRLIVICPYCFPSSQARVHLLLGIWFNQFAARGNSDCIVSNFALICGFLISYLTAKDKLMNNINVEHIIMQEFDA